MLFIFDLDQTLIDSKIASNLRHNRRWNDVYRIIPRMVLYPHILDMLMYLKSKGHLIAVVSTSPRPYCEKVINHFELGITNIVAYHDTIRKKPHSEPILKAIGNCNSTSKESISFGDRDIDIISSNSAGVFSCGCLWDCDNKELLRRANPNILFSSSLELYSYIKSNY